MPSSPPTILSLGEVLWDLFPEGARLGGAPGNFACHAAALGASVSLGSAIGHDHRGEEAQAILRSHGVDVSPVQVIAKLPTGVVQVAVDPAGKPSFMIEEGVAWDQLAWTPELESALSLADAVYFGTLGQRGLLSRETIRRALETASEAGIPRVLDVNLRVPFFDDDLIRSSVRRASIVKLSDDELPDIAAACGIPISDGPEPALRSLLAENDLDLVVMTCGADGALLVSELETVEQPGIPTDVCDTVGAGDCFTAVLVVGIWHGGSLAEIARSACERAAYICSLPGAVPEPIGHSSPVS